MAALDGEHALKPVITESSICTGGGKMMAFRWKLAAFLLALAPRLAGLGSRPFWCDEVVTAQRSVLPLPALIQNSFASHHTPVYFLLVAPLAHLPDPQFWLRFPSAIFGALSVMLVFSIATRVGGIIAGIAAALIMGLAPTEIAFSQEARSYMLMIFFLLIALQALISLAQSGERTALPWRAGGLGWIWVRFIAGSAAAFCTLGDALPWLLSASITVTVMIVRAQNRSGLLRNFLAAGAICLAACLPLYVLTVLGSGNLQENLNFGPMSTSAFLWYDIGSLYLMRVCDFLTPHFMAVPTPQALTVFVGAGLSICAMGGIWRLRRDPMLAACLLPAALTLPVLLGVGSIIKPLLIVRYLLWSAPPFALLAGIGFAALLDKWSPAARLGALSAASALLMLNLFPFYHAETKPRWDIAAEIFAAQAQPQGVAYYYDREGGYTMRYYLPAKLQLDPLLNLGSDLNHAEQAQKTGKQVWVIYGDASNSSHWTTLSDFKASLSPLGMPSAEMHAGSRIVMWRYDPVRKQSLSK